LDTTIPTSSFGVLLMTFLKFKIHIGKNPLTVCVVPRAKADNTYNPNQLFFKAGVRNAVIALGNNFVDGTNYIQDILIQKQHTFAKPIEGYNNDGSVPYVGITNATCNISDNVIGKDILLIDDIYTRTVNIDEDAIQALLVKVQNQFHSMQ
jgi:hypothetical protein